jgi:hypothetical protein
LGVKLTFLFQVSPFSAQSWLPETPTIHSLVLSWIILADVQARIVDNLLCCVLFRLEAEKCLPVLVTDTSGAQNHWISLDLVQQGLVMPVDAAKLFPTEAKTIKEQQIKGT